MKKNIKKVLLICCSLVLCLSCCLGLTACDLSEVKDATTAGIEASSSVIPVEYSQENAKSTLLSAFNNSLSQEGYQSVMLGIIYNQDAKYMETYTEMICSNNGQTCYAIKNTDGTSTTKDYNYCFVSGNAYLFNETDKKYTVMSEYGVFKNIAEETNAGYANYLTLASYRDVFVNVVSGKYYQGTDHVYAEVVDNEAGSTIYFDFSIKNNLIIKISFNIVFNAFDAHAVFSQVFEYGAQIINDLPTSIEGYQNTAE